MKKTYDERWNNFPPEIRKGKMNIYEALIAAKNGKKIKSTLFPPDDYWLFTDDNKLRTSTHLDSTIEAIDPDVFLCEWEIYEEDKS